ncbi:hypothetical protein FQA39_LY11056 [Lamprigera yunnana]|nr:hypothetical protein FQA39_LY11056 [Lamprigera yunnana]
MVEIQEQVDNNSGQINGICERLREQRTKFINVETKINLHKEEKIQVCEDLKEQKKEIVNYIEEKIKIGNGTGHNVITNYRKIEKEVPKFHPSKNEHPKVFVQKLQTYLEVIVLLEKKFPGYVRNFKICVDLEFLLIQELEVEIFLIELYSDSKKQLEKKKLGSFHSIAELQLQQ